MCSLYIPTNQMNVSLLICRYKEMGAHWPSDGGPCHRLYNRHGISQHVPLYPRCHSSLREALLENRLGFMENGLVVLE